MTNEEFDFRPVTDENIDKLEKILKKSGGLALTSGGYAVGMGLILSVCLTMILFWPGLAAFFQVEGFEASALRNLIASMMMTASLLLAVNVLERTPSPEDLRIKKLLAIVSTWNGQFYATDEFSRVERGFKTWTVQDLNEFSSGDGYDEPLGSHAVHLQRRLFAMVTTAQEGNQLDGLEELARDIDQLLERFDAFERNRMPSSLMPDELARLMQRDAAVKKRHE